MTKTPTATPRWNDAQIRTLESCVKNAKTVSEGIQKAAQKIGKEPGAVQAKYYGLQKKKASKKPQENKKSSPKEIAQTVVRSNNFRNMPTQQLVRTYEQAKAEIKRRRQELATLSKYK